METNTNSTSLVPNQVPANTNINNSDSTFQISNQTLVSNEKGPRKILATAAATKERVKQRLRRIVRSKSNKTFTLRNLNSPNDNNENTSGAEDLSVATQENTTR